MDKPIVFKRLDFNCSRPKPVAFLRELRGFPSLIPWFQVLFVLRGSGTYVECASTQFEDNSRSEGSAVRSENIR